MSGDGRGAREAILHIGHYKTGTSFIQHQFHRHSAALLEQGVLYPLPEPNHSFALSGLFKAQNVVRAPSGIDRYLDQREERLKELDAELAAGDWTQLVLSGEALSGFTRAELEVLRAWLERHVARIRIVFLVRDPVAWAVSVAQQQLKTRGDVEAVLSRANAANWRKIIARFRRVFGRGALSVFEYEALAEDRSLFAARFAVAAGLPAATAAPLSVAAEGVNEAMSMEAAVMLGRYNARVPHRVGDQRNPARSGVEPAVFAGLAGARFDLPDAVRLKAYEDSRDDVAFVERRFGITRYSYPASDIPPSRYTETVSMEFLDALADRMVAVHAAEMTGKMLLRARHLREKGDLSAARELLRSAAHHFPGDRNVARELAAAERARR